MARAGLVAILAATAFGVLGADAAVCRPSSSTVSVEASSTASFSSATASSTVSEVSSTISSSASELSSSTASSTTSELSTASTSELFTTSTTATAELSTSSTSEAITTASTTAPVLPPPCRETQILSNPSFDDNTNGSPWQLSAGAAIRTSPRSPPNGVTYQFWGAGTAFITQSLTNVPAGSYKLTYEATLGTTVNPEGLSCSVTASIGGQTLSGGLTFTDNGPFSWSQGTGYWNPSSPVDQADLKISATCNGNHEGASIRLDNTALTRLCVF